VLLVGSAIGRPAARPEAEAAPADLACKELVDLVTDYLDGLLAPDWRTGFDAHLASCEGCADYVTQIRRTIQALHDLKTARPEACTT
jgi:anti-sigma factor RsiW